MQDNKKFISDENIPIKVTELLKENGFDVKRATLKSSDKQISETAKRESRIILTFDKHFLNKEKFPPKEHHGIIFISITPPMIDIIFFSLMRLLKDIKYPELKGRLFVLTAFGHKEK